MPIALDTMLSSLYLFSAPFLRMSAMMLVAPVFSAPGLSVRTRVLLATLVAALVAPSLPANDLPELFSAAGFLLAIQEVGVGLMIGFVLQLAFGAIVFGAKTPGAAGQRARGIAHLVVLECLGRSAFRKVL